MVMAVIVVTHVPAVRSAGFPGVAYRRSSGEGRVERNQDGEQEGEEETHEPDYIRCAGRQ